MKTLPVSPDGTKVSSDLAVQAALFHVVHFHHDDPDVLVFLLGQHLGNVPVSREENHKLTLLDVEEVGLLRDIVVAHHILSLVIFLLDGTRLMVEQRKALSAFHHQLEVYLLAMAFRVAFVQGTVLRVFHAGYERRVGDGMPAGGNGQQVGGLQPVEERLPLGFILVILDVELIDIECLVGFGSRETASPLALFHPLASFLGLGCHTDGKGQHQQHNGE